VNDDGRGDFSYQLSDEPPRVTAWGGLAMVAETAMAFGVVKAIRGNVKLRGARKYDAGDNSLALMLTMAAGGDSVADSEVLRQDPALNAMLPVKIAAQETLLQWLYEFHDPALMEKAAKQAAEDDARAFVPDESAPLKGLVQGRTALIAEAQRRFAQREATIDIDATIEESHKKEAKQHYLGGRGYQPMLSVWVEQDLIIYDQFRDGNVPAHQDALEVVKNSFAALPPGVEVLRCRGDTQLYGPAVLGWLTAKGVEFAIGAQKRTGFLEACAAVEEKAWQHVETRPDTQLDAVFLDYRPIGMRHIPGLKYIAVRMVPRQTDLLEDEKRRIVYLAVVTNRPGAAADVLRWYWQKAGTIEHVHDVVKNELGAGVMPCGRFGANAAWFRLSTIAYDLLSVMRKMGPPELRNARPKRLRLHLLAFPATLTAHARRLIARASSRLIAAVTAVRLRTRIWPVPAPS
jgi:hypothetical protein